MWLGVRTHTYMALVPDLERVIVEADADRLRGNFSLRRYEQMRDFRIQAYAMPKAYVRADGGSYEPLVLALWCCAKHAGGGAAREPMLRRRLEVVRLVFDAMARFLYGDLNPWVWALLTEGGGAAARTEAGLAPLTRRQGGVFLRECLDALIAPTNNNSPPSRQIMDCNHFLRAVFHRVCWQDKAEAVSARLLDLSERYAGLMEAADACFFVDHSLVVAASAPLWLPVFLTKARLTAEDFHGGAVLSYGKRSLLHVAAEWNPLCLPCLLPLHDPLARNLNGETARMVLLRAREARKPSPAQLEELDALLAQAEARRCPSLRGAVVLAGLRDRGSAFAGLSGELVHLILELALPDPARYHAPPMIDNSLLPLINPL